MLIVWNWNWKSKINFSVLNGYDNQEWICWRLIQTLSGFLGRVLLLSQYVVVLGGKINRNWYEYRSNLIWCQIKISWRWKIYYQHTSAILIPIPMIYDGCILVVGRIHQEGWFYFLFHSDQDCSFLFFTLTSHTLRCIRWQLNSSFKKKENISSILQNSYTLGVFPLLRTAARSLTF